MIEATIILGVVCLGLLVLLFTERRRSDTQATAKNESFTKMIGEIEVRHAAERRELLTRIQHPHLVPQAPGRRTAREPKDKSQMAKVGTIVAPTEKAE